MRAGGIGRETYDYEYLVAWMDPVNAAYLAPLPRSSV